MLGRMDSQSTPLQTAIERAGGQAALAAKCNVTAQAVNQWAIKGKPPAARVLAIEEATGVSRHELLPEVFGDRPQ